MNTGIYVGWIISVVIPVSGWIITAVRDRGARRAAEKDHSDAMRAARAQNETLEKQVTALQEANKLFISANPLDKAPWGDAEWTGSGSLFRIHHEGKRNAVIVGLGAKEEELSGLMSIRFPETSDLPVTIEPGDSIEFLPIATGMGKPSLKIEWHWEGEDNVRETVRRAVKPR